MGGNLEVFIRHCLEYDPVTGNLYHKFRRECDYLHNSRWQGKQAFTTKSSSGDLIGKLEGRVYLKKNIVWMFRYGGYPLGRIKFRDGNKLNCHHSNLMPIGWLPDIL